MLNIIIIQVTIMYIVHLFGFGPIAVAARSEAWVCCSWLSGIISSNPVGGMDVCFLCVLCVVR